MALVTVAVKPSLFLPPAGRTPPLPPPSRADVPGDEGCYLHYGNHDGEVPAGCLGDGLVGIAREETQKDEADAPDNPARCVVSEEPAVGHSRRAGQGGHNGPEEGGESAQENCGTAPAAEEVLGRSRASRNGGAAPLPS